MIAREELNNALRLLLKHKDLFVTAHLENGGLIDEGTIDSNTAKALLDAKLIRQPAADESLRITRDLTGLFDVVLQDARRLMLDADVGSVIKNIAASVHGYRLASGSGYPNDAKLYLERVEELVDKLTSNLIDRSRQLWRKIDTDFGYVSSIDMKIKENKTVLEQATRLNDSLEAIEVKDINRLSGNDWQLRLYLNRWLLGTVDICLKETVDAIHKLKELLFEYRKKQRLNRLVDTFYRRFQLDPDYRPLDYTDMGDIPEVFNQVAPLIHSGHADLEDPRQEIEINSIISGLRKEYPEIEEPDTDTFVPVLPVEPPVRMSLSPLSQAVQDFYVNVIESNKKLSALEWGFTADIEPEHDLEIWLYAVMARFTNMDEEEKVLFSIEFEETTDPVFDGKSLVHDIYVSMSNNFAQSLAGN